MILKSFRSKSTTGGRTRGKYLIMISHKHVIPYLFIHIPKNAGTTLCRYLEEYVEGEYCSKNWSEHKSLEEYAYLPENYFKFAVIRNPRSRVVSFYHYQKEQAKTWSDQDQTLPCGKPRPLPWKESKERLIERSFKQMVLEDLQETPSKNLGSNLYWITINDQVKTDFIIRYENFQEDFEIVCGKLNIPSNILGRLNTTRHAHYTTYYDDETRRFVEKLYADDIEYFGYKFGDD